MNEAVEGGTLYIVSTPIGNLEDISLRAVRILSGVDIVAAEDTRTTRVLLDHYAIRKPLISYHSYNEARRTPELIAKLQSGISDPALRVISSALKAQIPVQPVPGASAFLPALIVSGLPTDRFTFEGFLPVKKGRRTKLERLRDEHQTINLYESPHRLLRTLRDLRDVVGDREIAVARELTKKFEEIVRGNIAEVLDHFSTHAIRGEFVLVIAANPSARRPLTGEGDGAVS